MQMAGGGGSFLGAAQQGMFAVDTHSGRAMVMSIGEIRQELTQALARINDLKERARLGDMSEAQAIAKLDSEVAAGSPQSLEHVMQHFRDRLEEAQQALEIGMRNYEEIEAQAEEGFGRMGHR